MFCVFVFYSRNFSVIWYCEFESCGENSVTVRSNDFFKFVCSAQEIFDFCRIITVRIEANSLTICSNYILSLCNWCIFINYIVCDNSTCHIVWISLKGSNSVSPCRAFIFVGSCNCNQSTFKFFSSTYSLFTYENILRCISNLYIICKDYSAIWIFVIIKYIIRTWTCFSLSEYAIALIISCLNNFSVFNSYLYLIINSVIIFRSNKFFKNIYSVRKVIDCCCAVWVEKNTLIIVTDSIVSCIVFSFWCDFCIVKK